MLRAHCSHFLGATSRKRKSLLAPRSNFDVTCTRVQLYIALSHISGATSRNDYSTAYSICIRRIRIEYGSVCAHCLLV